MDVPARCVAVYIVNKISDVFTAILQAVGAKADPGSVCENESHGLLVISQGGSCATLVLIVLIHRHRCVCTYTHTDALKGC